VRDLVERMLKSSGRRVDLSTPFTPAAARFLDASVASGLNLIVAGGTQAGKTTLGN